VILEEQDLQIDFTNAIDALVFDQMDSTKSNYHGVARMARVDFIVEVEEAIYFIEIKDLENPKSQRKGINQFLEKINNGTLADSFAKKYVESFIYRWAEGKVHKPIHYIGLITMEQPILDHFITEIKRKLPPMGRSVPRWKCNFVESCVVLNLETWNTLFPKWPARRISSTR
jgi:hypothetical protein